MPERPELRIDPAWEVHPAQVKQWLDHKEDMLIVDVRQPWEYNLAKIDGAVLIPLNELDRRAEAELAGCKNRRIVVQCHHGVRSLNGTAILRRHGFTMVHSMAGGLEVWSVLVDPSVPRY